MGHGFVLATILLTCLVQQYGCKEICCAHIGCFTDNAPFDHLALPECPDTMDMKFFIYNKIGKNQLSRQNVLDFLQTNTKTIFLIHGYQNDGETSWLLEIKDELLKADDYNVVIVDWGGGAGHLFYPWSASNTRSVGAETADMMDLLVSLGVTHYNDLWCVGFSLGAHACGHAGMRTERKIGHVTGLDPAGPKFDGYSLEAGVNPGSAEFVDIMHTDGYGLAAYYGTLRPLGHADYYPNEGWYQPGCWTYMDKHTTHRMKRFLRYQPQRETVAPYGMSCSHSRAPQYFIESIRHPGCFKSRHKCTDHNDLPGSCTEAPSGRAHTSMGYGADPTKHGIYYLETTRYKPFCKY